MTKFSRTEISEEIAGDLWRYLSPGANQELSSPTPSTVGGAIDSSMYRQILTAHLSLAPETIKMLEVAPKIIERLPSVATRRLAELDGEVSGDVDVGRTLERRLEVGDETLFVCRTVERQFESLHARVLKTALQWCERFGAASPYGTGALQQVMEQSAESARRVQSARRSTRSLKLAGVRPLQSPSQAQLGRVERRFGMQPVVDYIRHVQRVLEDNQPDAVAKLFRDVVLAPAADDRLFELKVGFQLARSLEGRGWRVRTLQAFSGSDQPFAELEREGDRLLIWDQRSPGRVPGLPSGPSLYREVREANGFSAASLRPDFIIHHPESERVLVVEVKLTAADGRNQVRNGISDVLAYLRDRPDLFAGESTPHGAVVAWDARSTPSIDSVVMVCSQNQISLLADALLGFPDQPLSSQSAGGWSISTI